MPIVPFYYLFNELLFILCNSNIPMKIVWIEYISTANFLADMFSLKIKDELSL